MTLKSIELLGFKSFGKKANLSFDTPITSIVGPNGSGKSNVVEAIRFVLGEQSMKSLRGKGGVDLIFKGSKTLSSSSRASVSMTFDNSKKIFSFTNSGLGIALDYDEISISRTVYPDGANVYNINNTEVRLKDIVDLLSSVNIGSSGHHIISQGEADRVLNASNKDRRSMIEDALGLRVYQYRIKESLRKLDKTIENVKEVQSQRKEVLPHLNFLKKQVEKVEKSHAMSLELLELYRSYISNEASFIKHESSRIYESRRALSTQLSSIEERINKLEQNKKENTQESVYIGAIKEKESVLQSIREEKNTQLHSTGKLEATLESVSSQIQKLKSDKDRLIPLSTWASFIKTLEESLDKALSSNDFVLIKQSLQDMKDSLSVIKDDEKDKSHDIQLESQYENIKAMYDDVRSKIEDLNKKEIILKSEIESLRQKDEEEKRDSRESEHVLYTLLQEKTQTEASINALSFEEEKIKIIKTNFEMEVSEGATLIGREVISFTHDIKDEKIDRSLQDEMHRKIQRLKIKIEEAGAGNADDIVKEYNETKERDEFLSHEIDDLNKGISDLHTLIQDLKQTLDTQFKKGVEDINKQFQEFFSIMFGGGSAFLSITMEHKKIKKNDDELDIDKEDQEDDKDIGFERGIEINVSLPQKKVKDLHMLSGGERSLTSIALLFAISQVNPPPFLVLDETDAALDEANSRRYGSMLSNLSKYSQLIVVTHNRETMSRAQVLYGITMDSSGASKLLSIKLEDATIYAK